MGLTRELQKMPEDIDRLLSETGLRAAYDARPHYQRNDYLSWIARAKQEATREKRLQQMLNELRQGDVYMKMKWNGGSSAL